MVSTSHFSTEAEAGSRLSWQGLFRGPRAWGCCDKTPLALQVKQQDPFLLLGPEARTGRAGSS